MSLELKGFAHVFAIATLYNFGIGIGEQQLKKYISFQTKFSPILKSTKKSINPFFTKYQTLKSPSKRLSKKLNKFHKRAERLSIKTIDIFEITKSPKNFCIVEWSFTPYYIFFGLYSFFLIIIAEGIEYWRLYNSLIIFNIACVFSILICAIKTFFYLHPNCRFIGTIKTSAIFCALFIICFLALPYDLTERLMIVEINEHDYLNWICLGSLFLAFSPGLVNLGFLICYYLRILWLKWRGDVAMRKASYQIIKELIVDFPTDLPELPKKS
jgi:hypothetical protein